MTTFAPETETTFLFLNVVFSCLIFAFWIREFSRYSLITFNLLPLRIPDADEVTISMECLMLSSTYSHRQSTGFQFVCLLFSSGGFCKDLDCVAIRDCDSHKFYISIFVIVFVLIILLLQHLFSETFTL